MRILLISPLLLSIFSTAHSSEINAETIVTKGEILHSSESTHTHRFSVKYKNKLYFCLHNLGGVQCEMSSVSSKKSDTSNRIDWGKK